MHSAAAAAAAAAAASSGPMSPVKINCGISDEELVTLSVRDLNRHLKIRGLTREDITLMKQRFAYVSIFYTEYSSLIWLWSGLVGSGNAVECKNMASKGHSFQATDSIMWHYCVSERYFQRVMMPNESVKDLFWRILRRVLKRSFAAEFGIITCWKYLLADNNTL